MTKTRLQMHYRKKVIAAGLIIIGSTALVIGILGVVDYLIATRSGPTVPSSAVVNTTDLRPSEKDPGGIQDSYVVPADQPRVIEIQDLSIKAYVHPVGVDSGGAMATPSNIFFTGWYDGSAAPGENGLSIINGHAGGRYNDGIFKRLGSLKKKDSIRIQMGDSTWREFAVVSVNTYGLEESQKKLFEENSQIKSALHVITCDGVFDETAQTYDKRTIVVAERIQ